ncbi:30S ribosome-binding factor RbfA [Natranaerobius thermophilus]|uniref:Ribosome-binding factor A n=1 Tax=Natranaerobius thermophilus (strain ATCC BAA-1301 / DSM 18059 / JW/NM-WN-LF) TaxID=457570 RepID=RBFA_NATTJ|nr:30S ribosome-binding factor RbfA [Natranaerobius thermophilus]B2A398.1 RecName: Full=Ribosome-binding factor A [Natranaerobius thermophilus JW/NM-WN-LF]ACB85028.1 ribosome-binding factor A [Natranaerobius thermophilus JW/NM-WN-LF]
MSGMRKEKLQEELKKIISDILQREVKDPSVGFVTVTSVDLSGDLRHAKVFVSILGEKENQQDSLRGLEKATGFIRSELGKRVRLRHVPEIVFKFDESIEHGDHINKLLKQMNLGEDNEDNEDKENNDPGEE